MPGQFLAARSDGAHHVPLDPEEWLRRRRARLGTRVPGEACLATSWRRPPRSQAAAATAFPGRRRPPRLVGRCANLVSWAAAWCRPRPVLERRCAPIQQGNSPLYKRPVIPWPNFPFPLSLSHCQNSTGCTLSSTSHLQPLPSPTTLRKGTRLLEEASVVLPVRRPPRPHQPRMLTAEPDDGKGFVQYLPGPNPFPHPPRAQDMIAAQVRGEESTMEADLKAAEKKLKDTVRSCLR